MSTALVLSNQNLLVNIDYNGQLKDLYFPHVGMENQLNKYRNKFFVRIDNEFIDFESSKASIEIDYEPYTAVGKLIITFPDYKVRLVLKDYVLIEKNIYVRDYELENYGNSSRSIIIYMQNNFALSESMYSDTATWYQPSGVLLHYKNNRYLAIASKKKFYQINCAAKSDNFGLGAYPNSEGKLEYNIVATGSVNSCISIKCELAASEKSFGDVSIIAAKSLAEIENLVNYYRGLTNSEMYTSVKRTWGKLLNTEDRQLKLASAFDQTDASTIRNNYWRSIVQIISQIDKQGCIVAANDGHYLKEDGVDSYSYYWPRDGANVILALNKLGQQKVARRCLNYSLKMTEGRGYFMHKYLPVTDAEKPALGSSWHGWVDYRGQEILPIQEDATAMNLIVIVDYFKTFKDKQFLIKNWNYIESIIKFLKSYNFKRYRGKSSINDYVEGFNFNNENSFASKSNLPYPSFDIWEQYFGIFTHTSILLLEAIKSAIEITEEINAIYLKQDLEAYYINLKKDIVSYLVDKNDNTFIKGFIFSETEKKIYKDSSMDAALINAFNISTDADVKAILKNTIDLKLKKILINTEIRGIARKEEDHYLHLEGDYQGNPWILTSLWMAEYAKQNGDNVEMNTRLKWVLKHTDHTGLMAEQTNPYSGFALGVKPLTWNHAEFIRLLWS